MAGATTAAPVEASEKVPSVPFIINGVEVHTDDIFNVISPATGKLVHTSSSAKVSHALAAVDAGAKAFVSWCRTPPSERRDILLKAAEVMNRRREEIMKYMMDETGAVAGWADFNINTAREFMIDCAGRIAGIEGSVPTVQDPNFAAMIVKEPYGVILAMAPWNAPIILGLRSFVWAIAAGNTVVLKGSELAPRCFWVLASILQEAGLPNGVLNYITSDPSNVAAVVKGIISSPEIKKINFTGSTAVGRIIGRLAGENLKPLLLELGGKAPAIVWEDADLELAAVQCTVGAFLASGQICMSTERIIVHKAIRAAFEEKLLAVVDQIYSPEQGAPVLIHAGAADKNRRLIEDAVAKGARLLSKANFEATETSRTRMRPTIIGGITAEMDIYKTESFGPTVSLIEVETEEEALRIANDTEYGLTSAIFTSDLRRALRMAKQIETGAVHINSMTVHDEAVLPHGGAKSSGYGRFNTFGLEEWVRTKTITYAI